MKRVTLRNSLCPTSRLIKYLQLGKLEHDPSLGVVDLLEKDGRYPVFGTSINAEHFTFAELKVQDLHAGLDLRTGVGLKGIRIDFQGSRSRIGTLLE